jgi:hypothetical protein
MTTLAQIETFAHDEINAGETLLARFQSQFAADPAYAFEWSQNAFKGAARVQVGKTLLAWLDHEGATTESIMKEVQSTVVRGARWPEHSTSQQSNLIKTEIVAVYAELLDRHLMRKGA